jgi:D-glycero-beta-D-manno-heptose-7-phosphate kinase
MIDAYLWGAVNRISPEAPIPIVSVGQKEFRLGGAANVALNIKALGGTVYLCSVIGDDDNSVIFKQLLAKHNLSDDGIICNKSRKTTTKTRIISGSQHLLRVDDEVDTNIDNAISNLLIERLQKICIEKSIDLIIFEDYDKGVLTEYNIKKTIDFAKQRNIPTVVDPKKRNFNYYSKVDLFKPNHKEFCEGRKCEIAKNDTKLLTEQGQEFISEMGIGMLLLTLSEHGVFVCDDESCSNYPAEIRDIADVSGAGDTVISVAGLLLCSGANKTQIAKISNIAGGLVCEKAGVVPIDPEDLKNEF